MGILNERIGKLRKMMADNNLESALILNLVNIRYFTGFSGTTAELLITMDKAYIFADFRYLIQADSEARALDSDFKFEIVNVKKGFTESLKQIVVKDKIKRIAVEENYITFSLYRKLSVLLNDVKLDSLSEIPERIRRKKDAGEISLIKKAAFIADKAFEELLNYIRPGISEKDISNELEYRMKKLGAEGRSFDTIVASGVRSCMPHGTATEKLIEKGDTVTIDFGAVYNGYCSDMTRTFFIKYADERIVNIYRIVNEARQMAVYCAKPGIKASEMDSCARGFISENGFGDNFGHGLGHGVGLEIHEGPTANTRSNDILEAGNIVTVEPGIYLEGVGGVRIEDMIVINNIGCEVITNTPRDILII